MGADRKGMHGPRIIGGDLDFSPNMYARTDEVPNE